MSRLGDVVSASLGTTVAIGHIPDAHQNAGRGRGADTGVIMWGIGSAAVGVQAGLRRAAKAITGTGGIQT